MTHPMIEVLHLPVSHIEALREAAAAAYPDECCGLLVGEGAAALTVTEVIPVLNVAETPERAFAIDPQKQFDVLRATRGTDRRVIGHYHSHPNGHAIPSARDLAMAHDPAAVWVVVGITAGGVSEMRAFVCPAGAPAFVEVPIDAG